jgi:hypothetical protein
MINSSTNPRVVTVFVLWSFNDTHPEQVVDNGFYRFKVHGLYFEALFHTRCTCQIEPASLMAKMRTT